VKKDNPENLQFNTYIEQAIALYEKGDVQQAEELLSQAIASAPDNLNGYYLRAEFYASLGRLDEALADYNKTVTLQPDQPGVYVVFADFFARQGQLDNALFNYQRALELDHNWEIYLMRAKCYERFGRLEEAEQDYARIIELEPQAALSYALRAGFYRRQFLFIPDKMEQALRDTRQATELAPNEPSNHFQHGLILLDLHRYQPAAHALARALQGKFEAWEISKQALVEFYLAWAQGLAAYYQTDDFKQALTYFRQARGHLANIPAPEKETYEMVYLGLLLDAYLQVIPLDNRLKQVLAEPAQLSQRTEALDGLRESFSGMLRLSDGLLTEIDSLLEAKRDICALLLPLTHAQAIKPQDSAEVFQGIQDTLAFLKYEHTEELIRILKENRQRLETAQPFTAELAQAANFADGMMTFNSSSAVISEKMSGLIKVPEEEEIEVIFDPATRQYIPGKIRRKYKYITERVDKSRPESGRDESIQPPTPPVPREGGTFRAGINLRNLLMEMRKKAGMIIPPRSHEILMQFIKQNRAVKIEVLTKDTWQEIGTYLPSQLEGFQHKQGDSPLMVWELLVGFALTGPKGHPPPEDENKIETRKRRDAFRKQVADLNRKLQRLLGITDEAIIFERATGNYRPVINLHSSRHTME